MRLVEVKDKVSADQFLNVPFLIYRDDPNWICPLMNDIESVFNPSKNNFFSFGKCTRWILLNENGIAIGRIAAFINNKKAYNDEVPTGGCGFFECINDQAAAIALFDQAKNWLSEHGMKAMMGPINFGETDMWWGLLVDGFSNPYYGMNYNPSYYQQFFVEYGFNVKYEQISNKIDVVKGMPEKVFKIAKWVEKKNGYIFKPLDPKHISKFAADFKEIYNDAWKDFENFLKDHILLYFSNINF